MQVLDVQDSLIGFSAEDQERTFAFGLQTDSDHSVEWLAIYNRSTGEKIMEVRDIMIRNILIMGRYRKPTAKNNHG